jgi:hypothetical protein
VSTDLGGEGLESARRIEVLPLDIRLADPWTHGMHPRYSRVTTVTTKAVTCYSEA